MNLVKELPSLGVLTLLLHEVVLPHFLDLTWIGAQEVLLAQRTAVGPVVGLEHPTLEALHVFIELVGLDGLLTSVTLSVSDITDTLSQEMVVVVKDLDYLIAVGADDEHGALLEPVEVQHVRVLEPRALQIAKVTCVRVTGGETPEFTGPHLGVGQVCVVDYLTLAL